MGKARRHRDKKPLASLDFEVTANGEAWLAFQSLAQQPNDVRRHHGMLGCSLGHGLYHPVVVLVFHACGGLKRDILGQGIELFGRQTHA